jgi:ATP phosphoribosyltransferase
MSRPLRIALPKGRMMDEALELWSRIGSGIQPGDETSRRLILPSRDGRFEFLPVKNGDVPTYVESGVADAGVVGLDVLAEEEPDVLRPLDLGFGACRLSVAAPVGAPYPYLPGGATPRVATKYVRAARGFFAERGIQAELVRISGSVEIAPLLGLSDWILDLVQTGRTLEENGLVVVDTAFASTARLIVNRASHKLRLAEHQRLIAELEAALESPAGAGAAAGAAAGVAR